MSVFHNRIVVLLVEVVLILMVFFGLFLSDSHVPGQDVTVHQQIAGILQQEVPVDVSQIALERVGNLESCYLSNAGRDENAYLGDVPHDTRIYGRFRRSKASPSVWESMNPEGYWLSTTVADKVRHDGDAISAEDFRQIVRGCVKAVRAEIRRPRQWPLTTAENRSSWGGGVQR